VYNHDWMAFNRPIPDRKQESKDSGGARSLVQAEKLIQIAVLLPSAALVGWLGGAWLDGKLHQTWIGLVGILVGGIAGLIYVIRLVMTSGSAGNSQSSGKDQAGAVDPSIKP
jgi:ATP synthase protein I